MERYRNNAPVYLAALLLIAIGVFLSFRARSAYSTTGRVNINSTAYPPVPSVTNNIQKIALTTNGVCALGAYTNQLLIYSSAGLLGSVSNVSSGSTDVASDSSGNCYILNSGSNSINKYDANGVNTATLVLGSSPIYSNESGFPRSVRIAPDGKIYVSTNTGIKRFGTDGQSIDEWVGPQEFPLSNTNMAFNSSGDLLVCTDNSQTLNFAWLDTSGQVTGSVFTATGCGSIAIDGSKNIYSAYPYTGHTIMKSDSAGNLLDQWGAAGSGDGLFGYGPTDVDIDETNSIVYGVDAQYRNVEKFHTTTGFVEGWNFYEGSGGQSPSGSPSSSPSDSPSVSPSVSPSSSYTPSPSPSPSFMADVALSGYRITQGAIKSGQAVQYQITVTNYGPDSIPSSSDLYQWFLIPQGVNYISASTSSSGGTFECMNMGNPAEIGEDSFLTYTGTLINCGNTLAESLPGGSSYTITLNLEATTDFVQGSTVIRDFVILLDETSVDPDMQTIFQAIESGTPLYSVAVNNILNLTYGVNDMQDQPLSYQDPILSSTVTLLLPNDVTSPVVSAVNPQDIPNDGNNSFPLGLTSFQFNTTAGATKTVALYYDLPGDPSKYIARKYKTSSKKFIDVPNATITREDYNGKSMLKLSYDITDGGVLDQDGQANGVVIDPVGLASVNLPNTGENEYLYIAAAVALLSLGGLAVLRILKK